MTIKPSFLAPLSRSGSDQCPVKHRQSFFLSLAFSLISKVLFGLTTSSVAVLVERQPHRALNSTPTGAKPPKVGRFRSKTADFSSFLPLFFPQVHHFCSVMAIPYRGFRFFRRAAHRVESEKHRSPTVVGGLRRGRVSDLAFHVKRFTRIHLVLAQQVGEGEGMGEPSADGEDNKRWGTQEKGRCPFAFALGAQQVAHFVESA